MHDFSGRVYYSWFIMDNLCLGYEKAVEKLDVAIAFQQFQGDSRSLWLSPLKHLTRRRRCGPVPSLTQQEIALRRQLSSLHRSSLPPFPSSAPPKYTFQDDLTIKQFSVRCSSCHTVVYLGRIRSFQIRGLACQAYSDELYDKTTLSFSPMTYLPATRRPF
ncbi:uncharacterized protein ARMOST_17709 [Armillaria ostoyae]|uniref:Uncharacterized protein n=1 Tax=Armillaria ostoyae TaxID=47428 RepID=A0A284RZQ6_ARMOS|nr:uncharacterized protein ARMOST_17709 [Armillaria ostoyae]